MSSKDISRRAEVQLHFAGVNVTDDLRPYLLSLEYTDYEEDETDDLQIKLQDRDAVWLKKWLNDIVQKAASTQSAAGSGSSGGSTYRVTPAIGLNVRTGPGTGYRKLGALVCGTKITVHSISNGWAKITYSGQTAYVSASYITQVSGASGSSGGSATSGISGMKISAVICQQNWHGDGKDNVLSCGEFELDSIGYSTGPNEVTIKGTSIPYESTIRQTKKTKGWEAYYLSGIAKEIADKGGMGLLYLSAADPYYRRREQYNTQDITFLKNLCHDAGISMKVTNNILVLFDQATYEKKPSSITIKPGDGSYTGKPSLKAGKANTQYTSCRVRYTDPSTGRCIEAIAYIEDYKADSKKNQQLEVKARVANYGEAKSLAAKRLRLHNKYERTVTFTLVGNSEIVAGMNVTLSGWGMWDGKYVVKTAKHSVSSSGYTTTITLRLALEG